MLDSVVAWIGLVLNFILAAMLLGACLLDLYARRLEGSHWVAFRRLMEAILGPFMPVLFDVVVLASLSIAVLGSHHLAFAEATALLACAFLITLRVNVPLNRAVEGWSHGRLPPDWNSARIRRRNWNWARCALGVAAFGVTVQAVA